MVIATPQTHNILFSETEMPCPPQPAAFTLGTPTQSFARVATVEPEIDYSSPIKRPYSLEDPEPQSYAQSLSQILLRPFQYLKCKSYGDQRRMQLTDDDVESKMSRQNSDVSLVQQEISLTQNDLQAFWMKQREFLDSVTKRFETKVQRSEFHDAPQALTQQGLTTLSAQLTQMNQVTHQLQQTQQYILSQLTEKLSGSTHSEFNDQQVHDLFAELEERLTQQMQVYEDHLEQWKIEAEQRMNLELQASISRQMENVQVPTLQEQVTIAVPTQPQVQYDEQLDALTALVERLTKRIVQLEEEQTSTAQIERVQQQVTLCTERVHHSEEVLHSQTGLMRSMMNTASEKQESTLRDILARLDKLERQRDSSNTLQVPSTTDDIKTRSRSRSETSSATPVPTQRRQRSATVTATSAPPPMMISANARYNIDDSSNKNVISNLRKETLHQAQQILELKKDLQQMRKHMSTWRQENKTTKELVSKTKSQYEKLEGKINVMSAKGKDNLQLKGVSSAGVEYYEF